METIRIYVTKNVATCERRTAIVCGNTDYQIEFVLDDEWSAYPNRMARFIWNGQYQDVSFTGNTCMMPPVYNTEKCYVGLIAEGYQQITTAAVISCKKSVKCIEQQPSTEQFIHDVLNTDVPNDADDELSRFLSDLGVSIGTVIGSTDKINPQAFLDIVKNMASGKLNEAIMTFTYDSNDVPDISNCATIPLETMTWGGSEGLFRGLYKAFDGGQIADINAHITDFETSGSYSHDYYGDGIHTEYLSDGVSWCGFAGITGHPYPYIAYFDAPGEYVLPAHSSAYFTNITVPAKGLYLMRYDECWSTDEYGQQTSYLFTNRFYSLSFNIKVFV